MRATKPSQRAGWLRGCCYVVGEVRETTLLRVSNSNLSLVAFVAGHLTQSFPYRFPVQVLYYYKHCTTSDVYGTATVTAVSTTVSAVLTIVFSNAVRSERRERPTPYDTYKCPATTSGQPAHRHH